MRLVGVFAVLGMLAACATPPEDPDERAVWEEANDPAEDFNRTMFDVNLWVDRNLIKPLAEGYRDITPSQFREATHNFYSNVRSPVTFANDLLQGETGRAAETLMRLVVNSVAGMGGFFDVAGEMGLKRHVEDFGQTLAVWGMPEGPYLMLPLMGPSNVRDLSGRIVDRVFNPLFWVGVEYNPDALDYYGNSETVIDGLNERVEVLDVLDEVERTSIDFYSAIRSLYRQRREDEILNSRTREDLPAPSIISGLED